MKIEQNSRTWEAVTAYVEKRTKSLQDRLCNGQIARDRDEDTIDRARLLELRELIKSLTKDAGNG